ncbi:hypothetical protein GCM10007036_27430 [Alsobacter metallidurans]|uniref:Uncharacterized protein n=1 Tax=Alsobacter metallidurans TaxID=340221 RepID=A0A917I8C6_9HYPH|nr:hypothetical protein GCM10007036_27430 [Alsobacter metallidurans]
MSSLPSNEVAFVAAGEGHGVAVRGLDPFSREPSPAAGEAIASEGFGSGSLGSGSLGRGSARRGPGLRAWLGYPRAVLTVALARGGGGFD